MLNYIGYHSIWKFLISYGMLPVEEPFSHGLKLTYILNILKGNFLFSSYEMAKISRMNWLKFPRKW